jgi:hypothetical protein
MMDPEEEMRKRRREQTQAQVPAGVQGYEEQAVFTRRAAPPGSPYDYEGNGTMRQAPMQPGTYATRNDAGGPQAPPRAPQPTFDQMRRQGRARPAPPPPPAQQPEQQVMAQGRQAPQISIAQQQPQGGRIVPGQNGVPLGVDPQAANADPEGFKRWMQAYNQQPESSRREMEAHYQRTQQQSQGGQQGVMRVGPEEMITTRAEPGQINPWTGQMTPAEQPQSGQNFDVGNWLQTQLGGMGPQASAPAWTRQYGASNISGLMGMNAPVTGMPTQAFNPGQFDSGSYMGGLRGAIDTAGGNLAPSMYTNPGSGVSQDQAAGLYGRTPAGGMPEMYGASEGAPSAGLTQNVAGMYGRGVGQGDLPNFTAQALSAGGLDVASELANLYRSGSRGVSDEVSQAISQSIANPSAYTSDRVKEIYGQLGQNIDDEFAQRETALREEMAGRGLSDSSIQGGRLADLNVGRRSAREGLANSLGQQAAADFASARSAAIGQGMQRDSANLGATTGMLNQLLGTQQAGANLGFQNLDARLGLDAAARARQAQSYGQDMGALNMQNQMNEQAFNRARGRFSDQMGMAGENRARDAQRFGQDLAALGFQNQLGQQGFDRSRGMFADQLANAQFQQGVRQQNVQNQMGLGNQALNFFNANAGFGQQNFNNQLGLAQANDALTGNRFGRELSGLNFLTGLDQQDFQNQMARSQFGQQAGDQRYQQGLGYLDRLMGYGQQAFNNDLAQAQFNRSLQSDQDQLMMQLLGLGG